MINLNVGALDEHMVQWIDSPVWPEAISVASLLVSVDRYNRLLHSNCPDPLPDGWGGRLLTDLMSERVTIPVGVLWSLLLRAASPEYCDCDSGALFIDSDAIE